MKTLKVMLFTCLALIFCLSACQIEEIIEVITNYYNIPDGGLLEIAAYCTNRLEIAEFSGMDYNLLTLGIEYLDLKRIGLNNEETAILLGSLFFGIQDVDGKRHASLDIEEVRKQELIVLMDYIKSFVTKHCDDCVEHDIPSLEKIRSRIKKAKELPLLVPYLDETNRCHYGDGNHEVKTTPPATKWVKKKAD